MTDEEILKKAIKKAMKNGFTGLPSDYALVTDWINDSDYFQVIFSHDFAKAFWGERKTRKVKPEKIHLTCKYDNCWDDDATEEEFVDDYGIEALKELQQYDEWESDSIAKCYSYWNIKTVNGGWQYHLQQMALQENPIQYLEQFL